MRFKLSSRRSTNNGGDCCVWGSCDSHSRSLYLFTKIFSKAGKKIDLGSVLVVVQIVMLTV